MVPLPPISTPIIRRTQVLKTHSTITLRNIVNMQVSLHLNIFLKFVKDKGAAPLDNRRQNNGSNWVPGPNQGTIPDIKFSYFSQFHQYVEGLPPHGSHGDQFQASAFQPQMGLGGPPGPHMSEIDAYIHQMGQQMRPDLGRSAFPQARSMTPGNYFPQARSMTPGNYVTQARSMTPGNYVPQAANSFSSRNAEGSDSIYTDMANLSLNDSQHQIPTHLSSTTSDHQVGPNPSDEMGSSPFPSTSHLKNPHYNTVQQGSQINPTLSPRMNESNMVNPLTHPTEYRNNSSRSSSSASESTSPFNSPPPSISVDPNFDLTRQDHSMHPSRINMNSFNEQNHTLRDSYNDNSLVDTTGRYSRNVLFHDMLIMIGR